MAKYSNSTPIVLQPSKKLRVSTSHAPLKKALISFPFFLIHSFSPFLFPPFLEGKQGLHFRRKQGNKDKESRKDSTGTSKKHIDQQWNALH